MNKRNRRRHDTGAADVQPEPRKSERAQTSFLPLTADHLTQLTTEPVPEYQKPHQLVSFSYSETRQLEFTDSALKYYVDPIPDADLSYRYEHWTKRPEEIARLDGLLRACLTKEAKAERKRADVITWRGMMTRFFTMPYEEREGWEMNAMLVNGTLYLEEHLSDGDLSKKSEPSADHRQMMYYGYAFESFCTRSTPDPNGPPAPDGWGGDINTNVQWCSVVKSKLGHLRIILGGEVDCVRDRYVGEPDTFVELKTSLAMRRGHKGDKDKFEKKLLKFFVQSFLLGVPEIVVGFRSHQGRLTTTQSFQTKSLPSLIRKSSRQWDARTCQAWALKAISFVRDTITITAENENETESERNVYRVRFEVGQGMSVRKVGQQEEEEVARGDSDTRRVGFLPWWYWDVVARMER